MVGGFPPETIEDVRQAADIADVIGRHVTLSRQGRYLKGLCPFHAEKTPSFIVNTERQIYKCFGCGEGGNVFTFLMKHVGLSFPEAVRELAETYGVALPRPEASPQEMKQLKARQAILSVCQAAAEYFSQRLNSSAGAEARAYLNQRGLPAELIKRFGLGFSEDGWDGLVEHFRRRGVGPARVAEAGLAVRRPSGSGCYDRFRGRIIFPIRDSRGRVVAFGGRGIKPEVEPKYLNSPETPVFKKGRLLYGLSESQNRIRARRRVVVVEGYFDCLSLAAAGLDYAVATLGTSLTGQQVRLLRGLGAEVILVYDGDQAGLKAAIRAQEVFTREEVGAKILCLPEDQDPDDFVRSRGGEALESALERAEPMVAFVINRLLDRPLAEPEAKAAAIKTVAPVLNRIAAAVEQAAYVQIVARRLDLAEEVIWRSLTRAGREPELAQEIRQRQRQGPDRDLLAALINDAECGRDLLEAGLKEVLRDPDCRRVAEACEALAAEGLDWEPARLMDRLDETGAELVTSLCWQEAPADRTRHRIEVLAAVERLKLRLEQDELQQRIEAAQVAGDEETVLRLLGRKDALRRKNGAKTSPSGGQELS